MKKNVKILISVIASLVAIAIIGLSVHFVMKKPVANYDGTITVEVVERNENVIKKEIGFVKGDNAFDLVKNNFEVVYEDSQYGAFIKSIETLLPDETKHEFIFIEVNGKGSEVGITQIELVDKMTITFSISTW